MTVLTGLGGERRTKSENKLALLGRLKMGALPESGRDRGGCSTSMQMKRKKGKTETRTVNVCEKERKRWSVEGVGGKERGPWELLTVR